MHHIGDPPTSFPEEFELSEDSEELEIDYFGRVLMVSASSGKSEQEFQIGSESDEESEDIEKDPLYCWYTSEPENFVRTVRESPGAKEIEVVLDSGADISLAPVWMRNFGRKVPDRRRIELRDAQGTRIKVQDQRVIEVEFEDVGGNCVKVEEVFLISSVVHPLLAVGKLLKKGWEFRNDSEIGTFLVEGNTSIAVAYNNNSLTAKAFVRTVSTSQTTGVPTPIYLCETLRNLVAEGRIGWTSVTEPYVVHYSPKSSEHVDPAMMYPQGKHPFRAVLVRDTEGWQLLHYNERYEELEEPFGHIYDESQNFEVLTLISSKAFPPYLIGTPKKAEDRRKFEEYTDDKWSLSKDGTELIRYHHTPRKTRFHPLDLKDIPVERENLQNERSTYGEDPMNHEFFEDKMPWVADEYDKFSSPFGVRSWTGQSKFRLVYPVDGSKAQQQEQRLKTVPENESMEIDEQEPQAPAHRYELHGELTFIYDGHEYNQQNSLKILKEVCTEFGVSKNGSKQDLLRRLSRKIMEDERRLGLNTAQSTRNMPFHNRSRTKSCPNLKKLRYTI